MILVIYINYRKECTAEMNWRKRAELHGLISRCFILADFTWCTKLIYAYGLYNTAWHFAIWKSNFTQNTACASICYRPKIENRSFGGKKNSQQYYSHVSYSVSVNKFVNMYLKHIRWSKLFLMILCLCMCVWDLDNNESQCILLFTFPSLSNLKSIPKAGNISNDSAPLLVEYPKAL